MFFNYLLPFVFEILQLLFVGSVDGSLVSAYVTYFLFLHCRRNKALVNNRNTHVAFSDPGQYEIFKCAANFSCSYCAVSTPYSKWKTFSCCAPGRTYACLRLCLSALFR